MFYGDIETVGLSNLLLATPYSKDARINFGHQLDEETFIKHLYTRSDERTGKNEIVCNEIKRFNMKVEDLILRLNYQFSKVDVLYIIGESGCGITTFIHFLLWRLKEKIGLYDIINCEMYSWVEEPFIERIVSLINKYSLEVVIDFFNAIACSQEESLFAYSSFSDLTPYMKRFNKYLRSIASKKATYEDIYNVIESVIESSHNQRERLRILFTMGFFLLVLSRFFKSEEGSIVIVIDDFDHVNYLTQFEKEEVFFPVLIKFSQDCNYFFAENYDRKKTFLNMPVSQACKNTKLQIIFTTNRFTACRYKAQHPEVESMYRWTFLTLPENFYDHNVIISNRVRYYIQVEGWKQKLIAEKLLLVKRMSEVAYHTPIFSRLFNGSIRFCIYTLCEIVEKYPEQMLREVINLYDNARDNGNTYDGAVGYFIGLLFDHFKQNGIYEQKLHLSLCRKDGVVTLSRVILTILREKGGRCSLLDIFILLQPLGIATESIAETVWDLGESCRDVWCRLILFEMHVPTGIPDLLKQAINYDKKVYDINEYSELVMCSAGDAYLSNVLPHFEFIQSRHNLHGGIINSNFQPLFSSDSEEIIRKYNGDKCYRFELKIQRVLYDVEDYCYNSCRFAEVVMEKEGWSRDDYINMSFYNYHNDSVGNWQDLKSSYESRIVFQHVYYIENYRRYLLVKYEQEGYQKQKELSSKLIMLIIEYLELSLNPILCFLTPIQREEATRLLKNSYVILDSPETHIYDYSNRNDSY